MKKKSRIAMAMLLACLFMFVLPACSGRAQPQDENEKNTSKAITNDESSEYDLEPKERDVPETEEEIIEDSGPAVLVAYFSQYEFLEDHARAADGVTSASVAPGDVERIAGMIQNATGADLFRIIAADPYPADYDETAERARQEVNENLRPSLAQSVENMDRYNVVYLGYPVWAGSFPLPVATFLESYDFSGKTVVPFCTHEGFIKEDIWDQFAVLTPEADLLEGFDINLLELHPTEENIEEWLNGLGLIE